MHICIVVLIIKPLLTSSDSLLTKGAEMAWILCPTAVLPVNDIKGTFGCLTSASPARGPTPNTMFTTPGGTPEMQNG